MTAHVTLSSERMDWRTPEWFMDYVRLVIGGNYFDPATVESNPTEADVWFTTNGHYTRAGYAGPGCGLRSTWPRMIPGFANPVYGPHLSGEIDPDAVIMRKGVEIGRGTGWARKIADHQGEMLSLVPVRTETEWWRYMVAAHDLALLWSSPVHGCRISFIDPDTGKPKSGSNLASTVFYKGPNQAQFRDVFGAHGTLVRVLEAQEEATRRG